jgi:hypothetical protein
MEPYARIVVGYHGCTGRFARGLLLGNKPIREWRPSTNDGDWLGPEPDHENSTPEKRP